MGSSGGPTGSLDTGNSGVFMDHNGKWAFVQSSDAYVRYDILDIFIIIIVVLFEMFLADRKESRPSSTREWLANIFEEILVGHITEILAENPNGIFLSNGPGDPAAVPYAIENVKRTSCQGPL